MKMFKTALCAAVATVALSGAAHAADWSFNAGVATDYIFRGIDQTADKHGELFGGVDVTQDQFYGGAWLSNTGPDGEEALEYDLYAGIKPAIAGATFDFGLIYYGYTDSDNKVVNSDWNTLELKAAVSVPVGPVTLGGAAYYSPENGGFVDESTLYVEANAAYTFDKGPTISGAVGNFGIDNVALGDPDSYMTWNVGVTFPIAEKFSIDARYHGSDDDGASIYGGDLADDHFVLTGKVVF